MATPANPAAPAEASAAPAPQPMFPTPVILGIMLRARVHPGGR